MKKTFKIEFVDSHLVIDNNGEKLLVDTGSPVTIHDGKPLSFLGKEYPTVKSMIGHDVEKLSALANFKFDGLLGMDVMREYRVVFDYQNGEITFLSAEEEGLTGAAYPLGDVCGAKVLYVNYGGQNLKMAVDTGAPLSYVTSVVTSGMEPVGVKADFHPVVGNYTTNVFELEGEFAGRTFTGTYGNLPMLLAMPLSLGGIHGVVGYDFFNSYKLMFDFAGSRIVVSC